MTCSIKYTITACFSLIAVAFLFTGCSEAPMAVEPDAYISNFSVPSNTCGVTTNCDGECARTIGYWKNHTKKWRGDFSPNEVYPFPASNPQGLTYLEILQKANASDMTLQLAAQLIATELNIANGACVPEEVVAAICPAKTFLETHFGQNPDGEYREQAENWKDQFDAFNNSGACD